MVSYRILLVASIHVLAAGTATAQAPTAPAAAAAARTSDARPAMQLTALDYIEIEQLTRKYAWAIDTCSNDGFDYADLYTPDGAFVDGQTGRRWQGRNELAEAAGGNGRGCPFPKMPLSHLILNLIVTPTADGAVGKSYLIYPGRNGQYADEKHHGHDGGYQDIFVKTAGGWRFKERVHVHPPQIPGEYRGVPNDQLPAASAPAAASAAPAAPR